MIPIDRSRVSMPAFLSPERTEKYMLNLAEVFSRPESSRMRYRWKRPNWRKAKTALRELFFGKCAFCETCLSKGAGDVEHFRPKSDAMGLDGTSHASHYWWLSLTWENLYLSCQVCAMTKGMRFPVVGRRLRPHQPVDKERALLLDPCADNPLPHLVFYEDGTVAAVPHSEAPSSERKRFKDYSRAQVTIDTFGLNRKELIQARQNEAAELRTVFDSIIGRFLTRNLNQMELQEFFDANLSPDKPFLAMKSQLLINWLTEMGVDTGEFQFDQFLTGTTFSLSDQEQFISSVASAAVQSATSRSTAHAGQTMREEKIRGTSVESIETKDTYFARATYISRVEVEGVTRMDNFHFDFSSSYSDSDESAPWLMLLGENGVGKTSLLKAIALTLMGPRRLKELQASKSLRSVSGIFRRGGVVRVFLTSQNEPLQVAYRNGKLVHSGDTDDAKVILRAFGPSRWFPLPGSPPIETNDFVRTRNLFDPFVPLNTVEKFLSGLGRRQWREVSSGLKLLLRLGDEGKIQRLKSGIRITGPNSKSVSLSSLSSGYEAVIAMAADLTELLMLRWDRLATAEGIVLLDEIGAHLHPRWKMRIVDGLRSMFPRVQFIATTHEPLCLRGMRSGEILVMRKDRESAKPTVVPVRPRQAIEELRVDQILTSRIFGLHSTLDPEFESNIERYYELLSRHEDQRTEEEKKELAECRESVGATGILGSSRRDQLIYEAIDSFVAAEPSLSEDERVEKESWTIKQVHKFWSDFQSGKG